MHQVSKMTLSDATREINRVLGGQVCHDGNVVNNVAERGNTATTSHIVALMDIIRAGRIKSGNKVLLSDGFRSDDRCGPLHLRRPARPPSQGDLSDRNPPTAPLGDTQAVHVPPRSRTFASRASARFLCIGDSQGDDRAGDGGGKDCLSHSAHSRQDVGLLLYAGVYRDEFLLEPAIAALLAGELGLGQVRPESRARFPRVRRLQRRPGVSQRLPCRDPVDEDEEKKGLAGRRFRDREQSRGLAGAIAGPGRDRLGAPALRGRRRGDGFGEFFFRYFDEYADAFVVYTAGTLGSIASTSSATPPRSVFSGVRPDAVTEFLSPERRNLSEIDLVFCHRSRPVRRRLRASLSIPEERCVNVAQPGHDLSTSSLPWPSGTRRRGAWSTPVPSV